MRISIWLYLLEQICCSLCLLLALGVSAGLTRRSPFRLFFTALLTSMLSLSAQQFPSPWIRLVLLLPVMLIAPLLAWPGAPRRLRGRMTALSAMLSLWLTGLMRLLSSFTVPGALLLLSGCAALSAAPVAISRTADVPRCATVALRHGNARLTLTALIDSGNLLRDVITGLPVIVISRRAAARLVTLPKSGELLPGMRFIPVRTISGTAMMTIFRPDSVCILKGRSPQPVRALIGLSPDAYDGFQALVPSCLIAHHAFSDEKVISQGG
ncbi:MAG: sigma-E processing peptidase SpoIIGA [Clostridia bacterium]|nr:sigma-E processing peptidase SpoIIGA [Clostridia bacterium]